MSQPTLSDPFDARIDSYLREIARQDEQLGHVRLGLSELESDAQIVFDSLPELGSTETVPVGTRG